MEKISARELKFLWLSYVALLVVLGMGPFLSHANPIFYVVWLAIFAVPFAAAGVGLYSFAVGAEVQYRTWVAGRSARVFAVRHTVVTEAILVLGFIDLFYSTQDTFYLLLFFWPPIVSFLGFMLGAFVVRHRERKGKVDDNYRMEFGVMPSSRILGLEELPGRRPRGDARRAPSQRGRSGSGGDSGPRREASRGEEAEKARNRRATSRTSRPRRKKRRGPSARTN